MPENQDQVNSAVEETKQEETVEISQAEPLEQVQSLLGEVEETITQEETQVEEKVETPTEPIITDEIVEQFPQLKMYAGKLIKDLAPAYANLVRKLHDTIKENKELKGKLSKTSLDELGNPPDSVEHPEEFKAWLKQRDELLKQQLLLEQPQAEPQIDYVVEVQKRLPKDVDIKKAMDGWSKFNAERLFGDDGNLKSEIADYYKKYPQTLINEVVNFYNLYSKAEQNTSTIEKKSKEEAFKQTKDAFKKARQTQAETSQVRTVQRTSETSEEQEILDKIYQLAQG